MDARSLVGMTQGARKRAALLIALRRARYEYIDRHGEQGEEEGYSRIGYHEKEVRRELRIGERLRPCPSITDGQRGCPRCNWKLVGFAIWLAPMCDGSGVLPRKRP